MTEAVSITNLVKRFGETVAVNNLSLTIPEGKIYGILGPNGAGKTTTIHTLVGLSKKTEGEVKVFGLDAERDYLAVRCQVGFVPQEIVSDNFFTVEELLNIQSGYYGLRKNKKEIAQILDRLELTPHRKKRMPELSGGMKRRLLVAKALVHHPKLLILDEPTAGVDVHLRQSLWAYVRELNQQGMTILLTTHYIEEAEKMCDEVVILHQGQSVTSGSPRELIQGYGCKIVDLILVQPLSKIPETLLRYKPVLTSEQRILRVSLPESEGVRDLLLALQKADIQYYDLHIVEGDLEEVFLKLTQ